MNALAEEVRDAAWLLATGHLTAEQIEPAPTPEVAALVHRCVEIGIGAGVQALAARLSTNMRKEDADGQ